MEPETFCMPAWALTLSYESYFRPSALLGFLLVSIDYLAPGSPATSFPMMTVHVKNVPTEDAGAWASPAQPFSATATLR